MRTLAHRLSILLHPLFMPVYTLWLALRVDPQLGINLRPEAPWTMLATVAVMTIAFPLVSTLLMLRAGLVRSLGMPARQERIAPYAMTLVYYAMTWYLLYRSSLHGVLLALFTGAFAALLLATVITLRWKISAHMTGIGGLTGAIAGLSALHGLALLPVLATAILVAGLLGTARLIAGDHTPAQVYAGALLGFGCVYGSVLIGPLF